jgi:Protein of unknown function (DUF1602).
MCAFRSAYRGSPNSSADTRGLAKGFSISSTIRPGRADITMILSPMIKDSSMSCVTNNVVIEFSLINELVRSCIVVRVCASRAPNGSSISTTEGWPTRVRAMATRWRMPPDSEFGLASMKSPRPT